MGFARPPRRVNLICGILSSDVDLMARAISQLVKYAGPTDLVSEVWPFVFTDYYELEMGTGLQRQFVSFERLIDPGTLVGMKTLANDLEARLCDDCGVPRSQRVVNLDPGYLSLSKLVLATTKDYNHRLYLGDGIYGEVTLHYQGGRWQAWPWTYADYADGLYFGWLTQVREALKDKLSAAGRDEPPVGGSAF